MKTLNEKKIEEQKVMLNRNRRQNVYSYFWIFFFAIIYTIGLQDFLQIARVFSTGVSAFAALPTFIWMNLIPFISLFIVLLNIPIIVLLWKSLKKEFLIKTIYFLIVQASLGSLYIIDDFSNAINNFFDIGVPEDEVWPIIALTLIGSILIGLSIAFTWKFGGSTGGTDIIAYHFTKKKKSHSLGMIMKAMNVLILIFSLSISIPLNDKMRENWIISILSSICYIFITTVLVDFIYPKYKKVQISIVSYLCDDLHKMLKEKKYNHSWKMEKFESGLNGRERKQLTTIVYVLEVKEIISWFKQVDPNSWIVITPVWKVIGNMNTKNIE